MKNKVIGQAYKLNKDYIKMEVFDKEFEIMMRGYVVNFKPEGFLTKLLWRYIKFEVKYEDAPGMWKLLRKVKPPKFKYRISDIS